MTEQQHIDEAGGFYTPPASRQPLWHVPKMFQGRTVTIIAGGPSILKQNIHKVTTPMIVVNNSWELRPDADVLYFCDLQWWKDHHPKVLLGFKGIVASVGDEHIAVGVRCDSLGLPQVD